MCAQGKKTAARSAVLGQNSRSLKILNSFLFSVCQLTMTKRHSWLSSGCDKSVQGLRHSAFFFFFFPNAFPFRELSKRFIDAQSRELAPSLALWPNHFQISFFYCSWFLCLALIVQPAGEVTTSACCSVHSIRHVSRPPLADFAACSGGCSWVVVTVMDRYKEDRWGHFCI